MSRIRWPKYRLRGLAVAHLAAALFALLLCFVPLFNLLGFEFAAAVGFFLAYAAGFRACGAGARARGGAPGPFPGEALLATAASNLSLVATPLAVIALHSFRAPTCNWSQGLAFYALFPPVGTLYGTTLGFALGLRLSPRRARAALVLWSLATYAWAGARLLTQPPKFAFNAFVGYFPGPIYDTEVTITPALLVARGVVLVEAALFALAAALGWDGTRWRAPQMIRHWRGERALLAGLSLGCAAALAGAAIFAAPLGLEIGRGSIQRTLGGHIETAHCHVYYDRTAITPARAARLADEHEARYAQLAAFFGVEPKRKIRSYVYGSAAQKKRLMGAAGTSFEDALNDEFHINASRDDPHPTLTHEMAHIFAAQIDPWVPVCWKIGIHEGIAVAAEWDEESARLELTPHEACAAMDSLGLLPDIGRSLSATGFWTQSGPRVYTACGSFVRFLVDSYGIERFRKLWRRGDFEAAYGKPLGTLLDAWRAMLAQSRPGPAALRRTERLFRAPAIFQEPCAHEQARLESRAAGALANGDAAAAESLYARLLEIDARDPERWIALGRAKLRRGDTAGARRTARTAMDAPGATSGQRDRALRLLADAAWTSEAGASGREAGAEAESCYAAVARQAGSIDDARAAEVTLAVLADPRLRRILRDYLADVGLPEGAGLARLAEARLAAPASWIPRYLLGRRLFFAEELEPAVAEIDASLATGQMGPEATLAALDLRARANFALGRVAPALAGFEDLASRPLSPARRLGYEDWVRRARWLLSRRGQGTTAAAGSPDARK